MSLFTFKAICLLVSCYLTLLRFIFAQRDCHWIPMGLRRDCQKIALGMRSDWRMAVAYLHRGIAIGLPWGCGGIVNGSPWECWAIGGSPWDCLWIAFGFAFGIGGRWGLPRGCLRFANGILWDYAGIPLGLPKFCQGVTSGLTRDCLICGPGFYRHRHDPELGS